MRHNLFGKVVAKMDLRIKNAFGVQSSEKVRLVPKTVIELAKQMGYIEGIKGPGGGYTATDKGLEFLGYDLEDFIAQENKQKVQTQEQLRQKQREAALQRAQELQAAIDEAMKEEVNTSPKGMTIRKAEKRA